MNEVIGDLTSASGHANKMDSLPFIQLPSELLTKILEHLLPSGAATTMARHTSAPTIRPDFLLCRQTLWAACLAARYISACAKPLLYRSVLLRDCRDLLYLFRTLYTTPELGAAVCSFTWLGTLP